MNLRQRLMAGVLSAVLLVPALPAHAILPVEDFITEFHTLQSWLQDIRIWIQENTAWMTQLEQLKQDVTTATNMTMMVVNFIHHPTLYTLMPILNLIGLQQDLPLDPYAVMGLIQGTRSADSIAGWGGMLGSLSGLIRGTSARDIVYRCDEESIACAASQMRADGLSGQKGMLLQLLTNMQSHIEGLKAARAELNEAVDPKTVADATGQITVLSAYNANLAGQAVVVGALGQAQAETRREQMQQAFQQDYQAYHASVPR